MRINDLVRSISVASLFLPAPAFAAPFAYVATHSGTVNVVDMAAGTVVATIPVQPGAMEIAASSACERVYVTHWGSGTLTVIDMKTNAVIKTLTGLGTPFGVAFNPAGTRAYVADQAYGKIHVIATATDTVTKTFPVSGYAPGEIAFDPSGTRFYVSTSADGYGTKSILVIDVQDPDNLTLKTTVPFGPNGVTKGIAVKPPGDRVYFAYSDADNRAGVIDTNGNFTLSWIPLDSGWSGMAVNVAVNPAGTRAYVTETSGSVYEIDTATHSKIQTATGLPGPRGIAVDATGSRAYVANYVDPAILSVIEADTHAIRSIPLTGSYATAVALALPNALPEIAIAPESYDFGAVRVHRSSQAVLTVSNRGTSELRVGPVAMSGTDAAMFSLARADACATVAPGGSCPIDVVFTPTSLGPRSATLRVPSNDQDAKVVEVGLKGIGVRVAHEADLRPVAWSAIDPMALILEGRAYLIWVELHHPHEPRPEDMVRVLEAMTPEERERVVTRAKILQKSARQVEQAAAKVK